MEQPKEVAIKLIKKLVNVKHIIHGNWITAIFDLERFFIDEVNRSSLNGRAVVVLTDNCGNK